MAEFKHTVEEVRARFDRWIEDNKRCEAEIVLVDVLESPI